MEICDVAENFCAVGASMRNRVDSGRVSDGWWLF